MSPANIRQVYNTPSSVFLAWEAPEDPVYRYSVEIPERNYHAVTDDNSVRLEDLPPHTKISVLIKACARGSDDLDPCGPPVSFLAETAVDGEYGESVAQLARFLGRRLP